MALHCASVPEPRSLRPGCRRGWQTAVASPPPLVAGHQSRRPRLTSIVSLMLLTQPHVEGGAGGEGRSARTWRRGSVQSATCVPLGPHRRPRRHPREPGPRGKAAPREACWVPGSELDVLWLSQDCTAQRALRLGTEGGDTPGIGGDLRLLLAVGRGSQKSKGPLSAPAPAHRAAGTAPLPACRAAAWKGACKPADRSGAKPRVSPASAATAPPVQSSPERRPS